MRRALTATLLLLASPAEAQPTMSLAPGETLLTVEAEGEATSRPDMMAITAGVVTPGSTAQGALSANSEMVKRVIDVLRRSGIEARDVRTSNLEVEPRFAGDERERAHREGRAPRIMGYVAENSLRIRFRDLARAPAIIDALFAAGANRVDGPYFALQDPLQAERAAERAAARNAREEAEHYAALFGKRVSRVLRISERRSWTDDTSESIVVTGGRTDTPIEPGEITSKATLFVDYILVE